MQNLAHLPNGTKLSGKAKTADEERDDKETESVDYPAVNPEQYQTISAEIRRNGSPSN